MSLGMKFFLGLTISPYGLRAATPRSPDSTLCVDAFGFAEAEDIEDEMEVLTLLVVAGESEDIEWRHTFSGSRLDDGRVIVAVQASWHQLTIHGKRISIDGNAAVLEPDFVLVLQDVHGDTAGCVLHGMQTAGIPSLLNSYESLRLLRDRPLALSELHYLPLVPMTYHSSTRSIQWSLPTRVFVGSEVLEVTDKKTWRNIQAALRIGGGKDVSAVTQPMIRSSNEWMIQKVGSAYRCFSFLEQASVEEVPVWKTHKEWVDAVASSLGGLRPGQLWTFRARTRLRIGVISVKIATLSGSWPLRKSTKCARKPFGYH